MLLPEMLRVLYFAFIAFPGNKFAELCMPDMKFMYEHACFFKFSFTASEGEYEKTRRVCQFGT